MALFEIMMVTSNPIQDSSSPPHCRSSNTQMPPNHTWTKFGILAIFLFWSKVLKNESRTIGPTIWTSCWGSCRSSGTVQRGGQSWGARTSQSWQSTKSCGGRWPCSTSQTSQWLLPESFQNYAKNWIYNPTLTLWKCKWKWKWKYMCKWTVSKRRMILGRPEQRHHRTWRPHWAWPDSCRRCQKMQQDLTPALSTAWTGGRRLPPAFKKMLDPDILQVSIKTKIKTWKAKTKTTHW